MDIAENNEQLKDLFKKKSQYWCVAGLNKDVDKKSGQNFFTFNKKSGNCIRKGGATEIGKGIAQLTSLT